MDENDKSLKELVKELSIYQKKLLSLFGSFWRGVFYGFGFFFGSALLAAAAIYIVNLILKNSPLASQLENLINAIQSLKKT